MKQIENELKRIGKNSFSSSLFKREKVKVFYLPHWGISIHLTAISMVVVDRSSWIHVSLVLPYLQSIQVKSVVIRLKNCRNEKKIEKKEEKKKRRMNPLHERRWTRYGMRMKDDKDEIDEMRSQLAIYSGFSHRLYVLHTTKEYSFWFTLYFCVLEWKSDSRG